MASVRVEESAFADRRFNRLAKLAGLADADHARGKLLVLWRQCTLENTYVLSEEDVCDVLGDDGVDALEGARLGSRVDGGVHISGTKGRIEWLEKLRDNGRKGGRPKKTGRVSKPRTKRKPPGSQDLNPLAVAVVPSIVLANNPPSPPGGIPAAVIAYLNGQASKSYTVTDKVRRDVAGRVAEGYGQGDFELVIDGRLERWRDDEKMSKYLRPSTLFSKGHFAEYLAEAKDDKAPAKKGNGMRKTLDLLPGLKWEGRLHVRRRTSEGYLVDFDAQSPAAAPEDRFVQDRATLTAQQLKEWTGWEETTGGA